MVKFFEDDEYCQNINRLDLRPESGRITCCIKEYDELCETADGLVILVDLVQNSLG